MQTIRSSYLEAQSPRQAFYWVSIRSVPEGYLVEKISGARQSILDERGWRVSTMEEAVSLYCRILREKTRINRKRRVYRVVADIGKPAEGEDWKD